MTNKYILAVPNFSEGRDKSKVQAIAGTLENRDGVKLISVEPEEDFNRTVLTVIGEPEPLKKALIDMAGKSYELIDMQKQEGSHPRIGSQDTIPLFPLLNASLEECIQLAEEIGEALYVKHGVPIYFSGANARNEERKDIFYIRKGQYEGLKELLEYGSEEEKQARKPDLSVDGRLDPKMGATIVSAAEEGITAYNVFLDTEDLEIAKKIARSVSGPGGGFSTVRAVGIKFPEREGVVVSMNMLDCSKTPLYRVFEFIRQEARSYGLRVSGSELVGPVKLEYIANSLEYYLGLEGFDLGQVLEYQISKGI